MKLNDLEGYKNYLRIPEENVLELLSLIVPVMRESILAGLKLPVSIRFLFTGATFTDLQYISDIFRVQETDISRFVPTVGDMFYLPFLKAIRDHPFSTYAKFLERLTFSVRIRG